MKTLADYQDSYSCIRFERDEGVLHVALHQDGGTLLWNDRIHWELVDAFYNIAHDTENRVVVLSGTGDDFCPGPDPDSFHFDASLPPVGLDHIYREGKALLTNLLNVPCPVVAAALGRVHAHPELLLLSDIIIAAESTSFRDPHMEYGIVPGDGIHIAFPLVFGMNRGRYLALTSEAVTGKQAYDWGVVAELVPVDRVIARAKEIAHMLAKKPTLALRYTREALTREIARQVQDHLGYGLALEGLASGYGAWGAALHDKKETKT